MSMSRGVRKCFQLLHGYFSLLRTNVTYCWTGSMGVSCTVLWECLALFYWSILHCSMGVSCTVL